MILVKHLDSISSRCFFIQKNVSVHYFILPSVRFLSILCSGVAGLVMVVHPASVMADGCV